MHSLQTLVAGLTQKFPQESILLHYFDEDKMQSVMTLQPKFMFRGERTIEWTTSKSTFSRYLYKKPLFKEVNHFVTGINIEVQEIFNNYSLYLFLREAFWNIPVVDRGRHNPIIEVGLAGIMQHYGFDTGFLDITSDLNAAACFAATGKVGDIGQIMVLETRNIEDQYYDLTKLFGNRPKRQSAYVLYGTPELDLKSSEFARLYKPEWFRFKLTDEDKKLYPLSELLSLDGDEVASEIIAWYDTHISNNAAISNETKLYFEKKIQDLRSYIIA